MDVSNRFKGAIIYLGFVVFFLLVLLSVYQALKRGMCDCVKPRSEELDELLSSTTTTSTHESVGKVDKSVKLNMDVSFD